MKHNHNNARGLGACPVKKFLKNTYHVPHEIEFPGISGTQLYVAIMYMVLIVILIESPNLEL